MSSLSPRSGRWIVATGGAQRNPWTRNVMMKQACVAGDGVSDRTPFRRPLRGLQSMFGPFPTAAPWATVRRPLRGLKT
jgi:hypothetical protein